MKVSSRITLIGWALAVTGAGGIFTSSEYYKTLGLSADLTTYAYYGFSALVILAAINGLYVAAHKVQNNRRIRAYLNRNKYFYPRVCEAGDVVHIINNSDIDTMEETDESETKRIYDLHEQAFTVIEDKSGKTRAYYCLIPLTSLGEKAIREGVFSLKNLSSDFVRVNKAKYNPVYIGGMYGDASGHVNTFLIAELVGNIRESKARKVYARAATDKGLYWLENYGFKPVIKGKVGLGSLYELTPKY